MTHSSEGELKRQNGKFQNTDQSKGPDKLESRPDGGFRVFFAKMVKSTPRDGDSGRKTQTRSGRKEKNTGLSAETTPRREFQGLKTTLASTADEVSKARRTVSAGSGGQASASGEAARSLNEREEEMEREELLEMLAEFSVPGPDGFQMTYHASEDPVVAERNVLTMLVGGNHDHLLQPGAMFKSVRMAVTQADGEGVSDEALRAMVRQLDEESPTVPEAMKRTRLFAKVKAQVNAVQKTALSLIAASHDDKREIAKEAMSLMKKQAEGEIDDGLLRLWQFLKRRIPQGQTPDELFDELVTLKDGVCDIRSGNSAIVGMNAFTEGYDKVEEALRRQDRTCAITRQELICGVLRRGLFQTATEMRRSYVLHWLSELDTAREDGRLEEFERLYERILRRLDEHVGTASGQSQKAGGADRAEKMTKTSKKQEGVTSRAMAAVLMAQCRACKKPGHGVYQCQEITLVAGTNGQTWDLQCNECEQWGHIGRYCTEAKKS